MNSSPRQFCEAMRDLVERSQRSPATRVSDQAHEVKLRVLDFLIGRDPDREVFERMLRHRIADPDPQKELSRSVCCQILNSWQSGSCYHAPDGRLVLRALYPAEEPAGGPEGE